MSTTSTSTSRSSEQSLTDVWGIVSESKRILNSHSRHFLALSVLFILPLSFAIVVVVSPTLLHSIIVSPYNYNHIHIHSLLRTPPNTNTFLSNTPIFFALLSLFTIFFSLLAVSTVTSSVYRAFYGRPVKILASLNSLFTSFFPLLATFLIVFSSFAFFGYGGWSMIGLIVKKSVFSYVCVIVLVLIGLGLVSACVNWVLASVIVVVEGKWGTEPLVRSTSLIRGMRWVALMMIMFFGVFEVGLVWVSMVVGDDVYSGFVGDEWRNLWFVLRIVVTSAALTLVLLHSIAATTVLYMYCKALHGELAGEIAHEFSAEYVSLPFDEKKVPHVVCVVY